MGSWRQLKQVIDEERADPRSHVSLRWQSLTALLLIGVLAGAVGWLMFKMFDNPWPNVKGDVRLAPSIAILLLYPCLHGRFRNAARSED